MKMIRLKNPLISKNNLNQQYIERIQLELERSKDHITTIFQRKDINSIGYEESNNNFYVYSSKIHDKPVGEIILSQNCFEEPTSIFDPVRLVPAVQTGTVSAFLAINEIVNIQDFNSNDYKLFDIFCFNFDLNFLCKTLFYPYFTNLIQEYKESCEKVLFHTILNENINNIRKIVKSCKLVSIDKNKNDDWVVFSYDDENMFTLVSIPYKHYNFISLQSFWKSKNVDDIVLLKYKPSFYLNSNFYKDEVAKVLKGLIYYDFGHRS